MDEGYIIFRAKDEYKNEDLSKDIERYINTYSAAKCNKDDCIFNKRLNRYSCKISYVPGFKNKVELLIENHFSFNFWILRLEDLK